jgi:leader peptidase (prepilin peptidase) / N-methyltransferase
VSVGAAALGALVGGLGGLVSEPVVRRLPQTVADALPQPAWATTIRRPPVLEVVGALVGAVVGLRLGFGEALGPGLLLVVLLVPLTFIDIEHRILPNALVLPGTAAGLAAWAIADPSRLPEHALAAVVACVVFVLMALVYPAGMGLGDVKLALMLGAFLGSAVAPGLIAAFLISAVPSIAILVRHGRAGGKVGLPFGPFMALGGIVGLLYGDALIAWYI